MHGKPRPAYSEAELRLSAPFSSYAGQATRAAPNRFSLPYVQASSELSHIPRVVGVLHGQTEQFYGNRAELCATARHEPFGSIDAD